MAPAFCSSQNNMLLRFFLLFFLCAITAKSQSTMSPLSISPSQRMTSMAAEETLSALQLVATPDYPVAAGQRVDLHCNASTMPSFVIWTWQRQNQKDQTWHEVNRGRDLTLTEPEQTGPYRCSAKSRSQMVVSPAHTVYIISVHATATDKLGVAAFFLSLLALIINLATLYWLHFQRHGGTLTTSNTVAKGFPGPEKSPKGGLPKTDTDGDVYMNYTSTNQAYTDLDPTNMAVNNVYSTLS